MSHEYLQGRRFINLVRCSTDEQADTSPDDQKRILMEFGQTHGMIHAGVKRDIILAGVSGSVPAARSDIQRIINDKHEYNDFDVVLVQDFSRFTRGGMDHVSKIKWELAEQDVEVVFVTFGSSGDVDQDALLQGIGFYAAQQQAKSISYSCTRGQMSSIAAGNLPHTFRIPYGIDRLYVGLNGKPRFRIRNLPDGTQQKLAVVSDEVLGTFGKNPEKGKPVHYHRQSDEKVLLVPGDPQQIKVVHQIYKMKFVDRKGPYLIAKALNDEGIRTGKGKLWNTTSVEDILNNSTYTGTGIAERYATGIYHLRGDKAAPKPVKRTLTTIARRNKFDVSLRPRECWRLQSHPHLANYLDEPIRELAIVHQENVFASQAEKALNPKKSRKRGGDSHGDSPYVLKELLRTKQGNYVMRGCLSGPPHDKRRYYRTTKSLCTPMTDSPFKAMIPAEALEIAVLEAIKQVLLDVPNLQEHITRAHRKIFLAVESDRNEIAPLIAERDAIKANLEDAFTMGPASRKLIKDKTDQWEARALVLEERISRVQTTAEAPALDVSAFVTTAAQRLASATELLQTAKPAVVRSVLSSVITKLEVDLETRAVEMELKLPDGVNLRLDAKNPLCLVEPRHSPWLNEAQWTHGLKIAEIECQGTRGVGGKPPCFTCSRRAA